MSQSTRIILIPDEYHTATVDNKNPMVVQATTICVNVISLLQIHTVFKEHYQQPAVLYSVSIAWVVLYAVFVVWPMWCKLCHVVLLELVLCWLLCPDVGNMSHYLLIHVDDERKI